MGRRKPPSGHVGPLAAGQPVTIGAALPNYGLLVVDPEMRPLPPGENGEICIFGPGVAVGYLGQPELTAQRFVANPLANGADDARMYRTGDLGRIDADGQLLYLGRADDQVKIRGFRVELGEIEGAIAAEPGVAAVAVTVRPLAGIEQLVAFVAGVNGSTPHVLAAAAGAQPAPAEVHGAGPFRIRGGTAAAHLGQGGPEGIGGFPLDIQPMKKPKTPSLSRRQRKPVRGAAAALSRPAAAWGTRFL